MMLLSHKNAQCFLCQLIFLNACFDAGAIHQNCSLPALSIGTRLNSSKDLTRYVKRHKYALVGFSAASCDTCCMFEPMYKNFTSWLPSNVHWARVDMDRLEAKQLATSYDIEALPGIVFFDKRKPKKLMELHRYHILQRFVERSLTPLNALSNADGLASVVELKDAYLVPEETEFGGSAAPAVQAARIVAFLDGAIEEEDMEELTDAARSFSNRPVAFEFHKAVGKKMFKTILTNSLANHAQNADCLRMAKRGVAFLTMSALFDGEFVEKDRISESGVGAVLPMFKVSVDGLIFNASLVESGVTSDRIVVRPRFACRALNTYDGISIERWVLRSSLPPVGRFDVFSSALYESTSKPILMLFADTSRPELTHWLSLLYAAYRRYNRPDEINKDGFRICLVYIDGLAYSHRMPALGLVANTKRLPALTFNFVTEQMLTWQPSVEAYQNGSAVLTADVIDSLVHRYLGGEGVRKPDKAAPKSLPVPKRDIAQGEKRDVPTLNDLPLEQRLRYVFAVNYETFTEHVMDAATDVVVFFYASKGAAAEASKDRAIYLTRCAERFDELGISSVKIMRLDMSRFAAPQYVQVSEVPSVVFFPAFSKDPPYPFFRDKFKVQNVMWWIQDHASRKFKLPELPHLDEIEAKAYWQQKGDMPEERQKTIALVNEGSARRKAKNKNLKDIRKQGSSEL